MVVETASVAAAAVSSSSSSPSSDGAGRLFFAFSPSVPLPTLYYSRLLCAKVCEMRPVCLYCEEEGGGRTRPVLSLYRLSTNLYNTPGPHRKRFRSSVAFSPSACIPSRIVYSITVTEQKENGPWQKKPQAPARTEGGKDKTTVPTPVCRTVAQPGACELCVPCLARMHACVTSCLLV